MVTSPKMAKEPKMVAAMATIAQTLDSMPSARPVRIIVAVPVRVARAISLTGGFSTEVKYSVSRPMTSTRMMPMKVAAKKRQLWR
jgi:hypothetical protein